MPERTLLRGNSEKDRERCPYDVEYRYVEVAEQIKRFIMRYKQAHVRYKHI